MKTNELEAYFIKEILKQMEIDKPFPSEDFDHFLKIVHQLTDETRKDQDKITRHACSETSTSVEIENQKQAYTWLDMRRFQLSIGMEIMNVKAV